MRTTSAGLMDRMSKTKVKEKIVRKTILMAMVAALFAAFTMGTALADSRPAWTMGTPGDDRIVGNKYPDHIKALGGATTSTAGAVPT